jgi:hypothetical protein
MTASRYQIVTLKYYLWLGTSSLFFNRPCIPSPIKPRIRSTIDRVLRVDTISGLFIASSTTVLLSGEYQRKDPTTMGGINIIPNPMQSITTGTIEVMAVIVTLFTYYYEYHGSVNLTVKNS